MPIFPHEAIAKGLEEVAKRNTNKGPDGKWASGSGGRPTTQSAREEDARDSDTGASTRRGENKGREDRKTALASGADHNRHMQQLGFKADAHKAAAGTVAEQKTVRGDKVHAVLQDAYRGAGGKGALPKSAAERIARTHLNMTDLAAADGAGRSNDKLVDARSMYTAIHLAAAHAKGSAHQTVGDALRTGASTGKAQSVSATDLHSALHGRKGNSTRRGR